MPYPSPLLPLDHLLKSKVAAKIFTQNTELCSSKSCLLYMLRMLLNDETVKRDLCNFVIYLKKGYELIKLIDDSETIIDLYTRGWCLQLAGVSPMHDWFAKNTSLITLIVGSKCSFSGPDDYKSLFKTRAGDKRANPCFRLVPQIVSQPLIRDSDEGLDLVYTVSFVSKGHLLHVTEVRKMPMEAVFELLEGVSKDTRQHQTKRGINSFNFPRVWK